MEQFRILCVIPIWRSSTEQREWECWWETVSWPQRTSDQHVNLQEVITYSIVLHFSVSWDLTFLLTSFVINLTSINIASVLLVGMRRYGDISIQYRYGGSRYVSWPSAIYRDTTLTFVIRRSHHVVLYFFVFDEIFVFVQEI